MNKNIQNETILVTGGLGCIGSNLTRILINMGAKKIVVMDDMSSSVNLPAQSVEFIHCDIANQEKIAGLVRAVGPTMIFHLAAHFANQNSVDHPRSDAATNIIGLINVFEAVRALQVRSKILYASSSCVYGHGAEMSECATLRPHETPYAISKYAGELYAQYYAQIQKIPSVSVRIFNTYGPCEAPGAYRNVIPNFISKALDGAPITITGTGLETRDFTYVDDTADLLIRAAYSQYEVGDVFNGGTGIQTRIKDLAETIIRLTESKSKLVFQTRRNWDVVTNRCAQNSKAKELLGYNPKTSLEHGLFETISWVKAWRREQGTL
jgi:UDP-glucose 4-epimerase